MFMELTTVQQNYADTCCTEFYRNRSMDMDITHTSLKIAPYVMLTVTEPVVTILTLD
jgi:hypothetical protein